jgi:hypothetical protein
MRAGERKMRDGRMVELGAEPIIHRMAHRTVERKISLLVRRVLRRNELRAVAIHAVCAHPHENAVRCALVAAFALHGGVRAQQRKAICVLACDEARGRHPTANRMTLTAVRAHLRAVQVRMAGGAIVRGLFEIGVDMACPARHIRMHATDRVRGLGVVVELRVRANWFPGGRSVTRFAGDRQRPVRIARLLERLRRQERSQARSCDPHSHQV